MPVHGQITFIPNVFTPNGDEYNSFFTIKDLEKSKWDIRIFNRYGNPVYKKDNYANDWDGGDLSGGVYYYSLINSFCKDRSYKGTISIMR
jgi:gliding motility-associated-like protein